MLLDSIIICIAYLTSLFGVSQEVVLSMATMGRGGWVRAGYWTIVLLIGQFFRMYCL